MRFGIDPAGQPTHDTDATSSQFMGEFTGHLTPTRTRGPRSNDSNGQAILRRKTLQQLSVDDVSDPPYQTEGYLVPPVGLSRLLLRSAFHSCSLSPHATVRCFVRSNLLLCIPGGRLFSKIMAQVKGRNECP